MSKKASIFDPEVPLVSTKDFVTYWNTWYQYWEATYYSNTFKKQKHILGWVLPQFFGNAHKTKSSYLYSPEPYLGKILENSNQKFYLKIHPIYKIENVNNHLDFNTNTYQNIASLNSRTEDFIFHIIPWRSFGYHTDIANYLYEPNFIKKTPYIVENKILIPLINIVFQQSSNPVIYTESNYILSLFLINHFEYIQIVENLNNEFIYENNIKYKCFDIQYKTKNIKALHKCYL